MIQRGREKDWEVAEAGPTSYSTQSTNSTEWEGLPPTAIVCSSHFRSHMVVDAAPLPVVNTCSAKMAVSLSIHEDPAH